MMVKRAILLIFCILGSTMLTGNVYSGGDVIDNVHVRVRCSYRVILPPGFVKGKRYPILLAIHGYGMTHKGHGAMLRKYFRDRFVIVIPEAPHTHIDKHDPEKTVYAWFAKNRYTENMALAARLVKKVLQRVEKRFALQDAPVIIMGYSQGGAIALSTAGILHKRISGVITYGGWLSVHQEKLVNRAVYKGKFVLIARGSKDKRLTLPVVMRSVRLLKKAGARVSYLVFPGMLHRPYGAQLVSVSNWAGKTATTLLSRLASRKKKVQPKVLVKQPAKKPLVVQKPTIKAPLKKSVKPPTKHGKASAARDRKTANNKRP